MKNKKLLALVPMLLMTTTAFASPSPMFSSTDDTTTPPPSRKTFLDYHTGGDSDISYTCGVEVHATRPTPDISLGHQGYVSAGVAPYDSGTAISPDQSFVIAVQGYTILSSKDKGVLLRIEGKHHNKAPDPTGITSSDTTSIFLDDIFSEIDDASEYDSMTHNQTHKQTHVHVGLAGYSLQYRKTFLQTYYGVSYSCLNYNTSVAGVETTGDNDTNTQTGTQSTVGGGLWGEVESGVIFYETTDSAFMIVSRHRFGSEALSNTGSLVRSKTDGITEVETQTHNTKLDKCSYFHYKDNRLAISYVSKPSTDDPTFFVLEAGVMSLLEQGKDLIRKKAKGASGDFHTPGVYLRLSYTM